MVFAGRHERGAGAVLPERPPVVGPRWRPHEPHNQQRRPKDLAAYLRQFAVRPPAGAGLDQEALMRDRTVPLGGPTEPPSAGSIP